jgi:DNA (cytosine-5)-methyltransferase 1
VLKKLPKNPQSAISGSSVMNGSYFNLIRESMYKPCSTICQRNGDLSTASNCHPLEDRKFTIAELKRITSIPDDFVLTGDFAQRWERLGRMVPPIMMMHVAKTIEREILCKIK